VHRFRDLVAVLTERPEHAQVLRLVMVSGDRWYWTYSVAAATLGCCYFALADCDGTSPAFSRVFDAVHALI
jgi:hypothetical protein